MGLIESLDKYAKNHDETDVCVYCGKSACDKIALPEWLHHPEREYPGDMCHSECEREREEPD